MSTIPPETPPAIPPSVSSQEMLPEIDIDYDSLVTEDNKPLDNIFVEKLHRLLSEPLYSSWPGPGDNRPFLVLVNVGWFYQEKTPAVVPDCLLSLDVTCPENLQVKQGHSYYQWAMGKSPEVVIEIVSDRTGGEESFKKKLYARLGVLHYAVFDPKHLLSEDTLRTYEFVLGKYRQGDAGPWSEVGLGLCLWQGRFEGVENTWLRWCDAKGKIIPTGEERATRLAELNRQAEEQARKADERIRQLEAELRALKGQPPA